MTEDVSNLILEHLRRIRASQDHLDEQMTDVKLRLTNVEQGLALVTSAIGQLQVSMSAFQRRSDRMEMRSDGFEKRFDRFEQDTNERFTRIEKRLNLTDA